MRNFVTSFDRSKHVFHSDALEEILKDTIRFFNGTPVHRLPPPEDFSGCGVYALYYIGKSHYYKPLYDLNRLEFKQPIYAGKAVPSGWRQARKRLASKSPFELYRRLLQHAKSIQQVDNLNIEDFYCRFMILEDEVSEMTSAVEAALIKYYKPVWNSCLDGFGNHDPGKGRYNQSKSDWDILHPGRPWVSKCTGMSSTPEEVEAEVKSYLFKYGPQH